MAYTDRSKLPEHAVFGGSNPSWVNKSPEDIREQYLRSFATKIGTVSHEFAAERIKYRQRLTKHEWKGYLIRLLEKDIPRLAIDVDFLFPNISSYVNDAIGFRLDPEVRVTAHEDFFGTADAINYDASKRFLRIHDLKTGTSPVHMEQLYIYAAFYCMERNLRPQEQTYEMRIYQAGDIWVDNPDPSVILNTVKTVVDGIREINKIKGVVK